MTVNRACEFCKMDKFAHQAVIQNFQLKDLAPTAIHADMIAHYENTPIQIYRKFHLQKIKNFQIKTLIFFIFLLKT